VAALGAGAAALALPYVGCIWLFSGELRLTQKKSLVALLGLGDLVSPETDLFVPVGVFAVAVGLAWASRARLWAWAEFLRERRFGVVEVAAVLGCGLVVLIAFAPTGALAFAALFASTLRPELTVLLALGIASSARGGEGPRGRAFFFLAFTLVYGAVTFGLLQTAGYLDRRHLLPLAALLLGYAALGLDVAAGALAQRLATTRVRATLALVLVCAAIALPKALRLHRSEEVAGREAAEWVRATADPGDRIASLRPKAAYYAGLVWVPLQDGPGLRDGDGLRRLGARWVLVEAGDLASPDGEHLAIAPAPGQRFEPVFETERYGHRAVVFEVHEPAPEFGPPPGFGPPPEFGTPPG